METFFTKDAAMHTTHKKLLWWLSKPLK